MHGIDEPERAPPSSGRALVPAPDFLQDYAYGRALPWRHDPAEKLVPYAVSEEHEGGQHADKRSHASPGSVSRSFSWRPAKRP